MRVAAIAVAGLLCASRLSPVGAQEASAGSKARVVSPALRSRAETLLELLRGRSAPNEVLTAEFLAQVPPVQFAALSRQVVAAHGAPLRIASIEPQGPNRATVRIEMERALLSVTLNVEPQPPHRISGLLITGAEPKGGQTPETLLREFQALPGEVSLAVARLGGPEPVLVAAHQPERALAIGSAFKLIILAELARQVETGQRRWEDVVRIDRRSLPSGITQDWPEGAPVTLHTLAVLMISRSDNTATDVLLHAAGRRQVEEMADRIGMEAAARNRPFLSTVELFALKAADPQVQRAWRTGDEAARRRILAGPIGSATPAAIDTARLGPAPNHIDSLEWFASARDLIRVMDWLLRNGGETAHRILAVNSGIGEAAARDYGFVGYKGGSEPGVMNMTFLVRNQAGQWHAVTGTWNNPAAALEEARFAGLMSRAVALVR